MEVVYPRCGGMDVHQKSVTVCLLLATSSDRPRKEVRTFGTMTADLLALADWLTAEEVTHVALESTGVYWKPVWNVLEGTVELLLVNAHHVKQVPGRKTDVKDCEWLADLLRHGLLRASFVPPQPQRELRDLTRLRTQRVRTRAAEINRLHKALEAANVKVSSVASDLMGVSCRDMLDHLIDGQTDPAALAELARGKLRAKVPELERALDGRFGAHQRFLVAEHLTTIDELEAGIERLSAEIATRLAPPTEAAEPTASPGAVRPPAVPREVVVMATERGPVVVDRATGVILTAADLTADPVARLDTIPGVGRAIAEAILAEVGRDMSRFPSADHLASWGGLCPGNDESAGKRRSGKTRKGAPWLRTVLVEAAHAASHTKDTYLAAHYRRIAARRGKKKAVIAVAHTILVSAYHILRDGTIYRELGGNYFDERDRGAVERRLVRRLEQLGNQVILTPTAA
jgi:transposase